MDDSQVEFLESASIRSDEVLLSDRAFDTDPSKIVLDASEPQKLRFRLVEWLADSPTPKVKAAHWFRGMGSKLPEPLSEREFDSCLMKEEQRVVQAHGSVYFENLTYRCEELRSLQTQ